MGPSQMRRDIYTHVLVSNTQVRSPS